ncbi:ROK family protein [Actinoplanes sp. NBRC 103695]|uniref:ROK family protein n=1 Tax=Actinoplanes sp. NBRC 103695 TaxID=3032202 RepID=UPI0024A55341|nr:ROK family protein [Actinoplanes sp. NBRC 103695]GLY93770.1 sugar kinase [Actinoplanes sp. NBRC 103695]
MTVLAVDVGGTTIKGAVVDAAGRVRHSVTAPTRADDDPVAAVRSLCRRLRDEAAEPAAIGVVTPGLVDEDEGVVRWAANLRLRDVPLRALISEDLGIPVAVGHDVRAAGVAEARARGLTGFLLLALGTGIAAAVVVDGVPLAGATRAAGEVGHMPVHPGGEPCSCGQRGCLEVYASAGGLARRYARLSGAAGKEPSGAAGKEPSGAPEMDSRAIAAAVGSDPLARTVWDDATLALGTALATLTLTLDPAEIVLGGGLADAGALFFAPVRDTLRDALAWRPPPPVLPSTFGARAALMGAAIMARREAGLPVPDGWGLP